GGNQLGDAASTLFLLLAVSGTMLAAKPDARALPTAGGIVLLGGAVAAAVVLGRTDPWTRSLVTHGKAATYPVQQALGAARMIGTGEPGTVHYLDHVRTHVTELSGLSRLH